MRADLNMKKELIFYFIFTSIISDFQIHCAYGSSLKKKKEKERISVQGTVAPKE